MELFHWLDSLKRRNEKLGLCWHNASYLSKSIGLAVSVTAELLFFLRQLLMVFVAGTDEQSYCWLTGLLVNLTVPTFPASKDVRFS